MARGGEVRLAGEVFLLMKKAMGGEWDVMDRRRAKPGHARPDFLGVAPREPSFYLSPRGRNLAIGHFSGLYVRSWRYMLTYVR